MASSETFSVNNKRLHLRYIGHIDKEVLEWFLESVVGPCDVEVEYGTCGRDSVFACTLAVVSLDEPFEHQDAVTALTYDGMVPYIVRLEDKRRKSSYGDLRQRLINARSSAEPSVPKWHTELIDYVSVRRTEDTQAIWYWDGTSNYDFSSLLGQLTSRYGIDVLIIKLTTEDPMLTFSRCVAENRGRPIASRIVLDMTEVSEHDSQHHYGSLQSLASGYYRELQFNTNHKTGSAYCIILSRSLPPLHKRQISISMPLTTELMELKKKSDGSVGCWKRTIDDMPALWGLAKQYADERTKELVMSLKYD